MLILFLLTSLAWSNSTVQYLRSPVEFQLPDAAKIKIVRGSVLPVGTRLRVGPKGLVVLKGDDGSVVKLTEGAALEISKLDPLQAGGQTVYSLVKGAAFFNFPKIKNRKSGVRTKTVSFGIRGTEFFVSHGTSKHDDDVWMCVNEGLVAVDTAKTSKEVLVKAGEGVRIQAGQKVSNPKVLPWTKKLNWKTDEADGSLDNTVSIEEAYASPLDMDID